eukprot:5312860-Prymnesium_polylepis.1
MNPLGPFTAPLGGAHRCRPAVARARARARARASARAAMLAALTDVSPAPPDASRRHLHAA